MFGLQENFFVQSGDMDEVNNHRDITSKMDIEDTMDVLTPHHVVLLASREEHMLEMETDTDADQDHGSPREQPARKEHSDDLVGDPSNPVHFLIGADHIDTHGAHVSVTPIRMAHAPVISPFGTPTSRVGFPSTAGPFRVAGVMTEKDVDLATNVECTALSGGGFQQDELPPMESKDVLELIFHTAKDYRRAWIVSSLDVRKTQRITYELERDIYNIDTFQAYFEG